MALTDKLTAIGNAIRAKTGKSGKLTLEQMVTEIGSIGGSSLMLYAGGYEFSVTGGWSAVSGTLTKNVSELAYYSGTANSIRYATTVNAIDFSGYKTLRIRCRKSNNAGTAANYTVGLSTARGSGIVAEYQVTYSTNTNHWVDIDLSALDLSKKMYVFIKCGGTSNYVTYVSAVYAE